METSLCLSTQFMQACIVALRKTVSSKLLSFRNAATKVQFSNPSPGQMWHLCPYLSTELIKICNESLTAFIKQT